MGMNHLDASSEKTTSQEAKLDLRDILVSSKTGKKKSRRSLYILLGLLMIVGAATYYFAFAGARVAYTYTTQEAKRGDLSVIVTSTGSVQPTDQVDISSELSGTIRKVNVTFNSPVKAGDILAELDTNKLEADVQSARAKLASARANVAKAKADLGSANTSLERLRSLVQNRVSSQQDLDAAQFNRDAAAATLDVNEATVLSSEADLRLAEVNLSKAKIISPIDGVILTRDVDPGATVASSLNAPVLFTIAGDLRRMELQVSIDEADVGKVEARQEATFNVDAYPDRRFPAKIETVRFASETVSNVVTYKGILTVDNAELLLRPGMTATANIVVEHVKDALLVPNAALRYTAPRENASRGGGLMGLFRPPRMNRSRGSGAEQAAAGKRQVWVLRNGTPVSVAVQAGSTDGQFTAVTSDELKAGDQVITDATQRSS